MACYCPIQAWRCKKKPPGFSLVKKKVYRAESKFGITFIRKEGIGLPLYLPCGKCLGCRLGVAKVRALRAYHESQLHVDNCFVTLTYMDSKLPVNMSLCPRDLVLFWKRLRKQSGLKLRYLACGEYGDNTGRPHYHAIIFGYIPNDLILFERGEKGDLYVSPSLQNIWSLGDVVVGRVDAGTVSYVSRYCTKKLGPLPVDDPLRFREFIVMSRRPGLGSAWFNAFKGDLPLDKVYFSPGVTAPVPRYYLDKLSLEDTVTYDSIKRKRYDDAVKRGKVDPFGDRLRDNETIVKSKLSLSRSTL